MPETDDWALAQGTVNARYEERLAALRNNQRDWPLQAPACNRCTQGVMDATNSHLLGLCSCSCHDRSPRHTSTP